MNIKSYNNNHLTKVDSLNNNKCPPITTLAVTLMLVIAYQDAARIMVAVPISKMIVGMNMMITIQLLGNIIIQRILIKIVTHYQLIVYQGVVHHMGTVQIHINNVHIIIRITLPLVINIIFLDIPLINHRQEQ